MKDLLIDTISVLGYPVFLQGSMNENASYPDSFFTFWNNGTDGIYYDDEGKAHIWDFDLNFYSSDPTLVETKLVEACGLLLAQGFRAAGLGHDVGSDEDTHTGRGIRIVKLDVAPET